MNRQIIVCLAIAWLLALVGVAPAQDLVYREKNQYPVLDEIKAARAAREAELDTLVALLEKGETTAGR